MRNFLEFIPQTDDIDLSRIDRFQKKMSNRMQVSVVNVLVYTRKVLNKQKVSLTFCAKQKLSLIHWLI